MKLRLFFLTTILSLPCLTLVGCGASSSTATTAEVSNEPLSATDIAAAQAEMDEVNAAEQAHQSQNPVGKQTGKNR